jgi:CRP/FNR family transcriptional regulator, nitrogen fixation regulation protein
MRLKRFLSVIRAKFGAYEMSYAKGEEIYGESEPADYIYEVIHRAVRSYKSCPMAVRSARSHLPHDISAPDRIAKPTATAKAMFVGSP